MDSLNKAIHSHTSLIDKCPNQLRLTQLLHLPHNPPQLKIDNIARDSQTTIFESLARALIDQQLPMNIIRIVIANTAKILHN